MKRSVKTSGIITLTVTSFAVITYIGINIFFSSRSPQIDGVFKAGGISNKITVIRDNWGVPHITAENGKDAYFAYGFTIAQDRLFQMELQRRLAQGELSEILGPSLLKVDRMFRTYLLKYTAENYLKHPENINPEALTLLDSFLAGINFFIKTQKLPIEYALLRHKPREFSRIDVIAMYGYMAYSFTDAVETDSLISILKQKCPDHNIMELFPGYSKEKPVTIMETDLKFAGSEPNKTISAVKGSEPRNISPDTDLISKIRSLFTKNNYSYSKTGEMTLAETISMICPPFKGSNSWVIAPSRSASNRAILANDPHVALSHPGVWYEAHISYPGYEVYGYHIPMIPFPMLGHNSIKAWAVTMFENDDLDLYYETFNPADPSLVMYKGKWTKIQTMHETIKVKGKADDYLEIKVTPHGPVISDFIEEYKGKPVSMWWAYHKVKNPLIDIVYGMSRANTPEEFKKSISGLAAPGLNLSYADNKGNIAWWAAGSIPIRPSHVNSREILDGAWGRDEILGILPFNMNPHMINPVSGIIVTANNKSTTGQLGPIRDLEGYWVPTDRAARIIDLLKSKEKWSVDDLKKIQTDVHPQSAGAIIETITKIIVSDLPEYKLLTKTEQIALKELQSGDMESNTSSVGASIYHLMTYYILKEAIEDELGPLYFMIYSDSSDYWNYFKSLVRDEHSAFWDNISTQQKETRKEIIFIAYKNTIKELVSRFGNDISSWQWGKIHTIEYMHPLGNKKPLNLIFNIGSLPAPGEAHHINRMKSHFGKHDYKVTSVPSTRRLIDFGNLEHSFSILPAGNSGDVKSIHYDDQVNMFLNGEYREINFSKKQIFDNTKHKMELIPE